MLRKPLCAVLACAFALVASPVSTDAAVEPHAPALTGLRAIESTYHQLIVELEHSRGENRSRVRDRAADLKLALGGGWRLWSGWGLDQPEGDAAVYHLGSLQVAPVAMQKCSIILACHNP